MNGKALRHTHRAAMRRNGGLVRKAEDQESSDYIKTDKYVPFRTWLRAAEDDAIKQAGIVFLKRKTEQKRVRRIIGPNNPFSPGRLRRSQNETRKQNERVGETARKAKEKKAS